MSEQGEQVSYPQLTEEELEYASGILSNARIIAKEANGTYSDSATFIRDFMDRTKYGFQVSNIAKELTFDAQLDCLERLKSYLEVEDGSALLGFNGCELLYYYFATLHQENDQARFVNRAIWRLLKNVYREKTDVKLPIRRMVLWLAACPILLICCYYVTQSLLPVESIVIKVAQIVIFTLILASMVRGLLLANTINHAPDVSDQAAHENKIS